MHACSASAAGEGSSALGASLSFGAPMSPLTAASFSLASFSARSLASLSLGAGSKKYLRDQKKLSTPGSKTNYLPDQKQIISPGGCQNAVIFFIFGQQRAHFTAAAQKSTLSNTSAVREGHFGSSSSKITTFQIQAQFYKRI